MKRYYTVKVAVFCALVSFLHVHGQQSDDLQIVGHISIPKLRFRVGEPVTTLLVMRNEGKKELSMAISALYGACGSPYSITINARVAVPESRSSHVIKGSNDSPDIIGSCTYGSRDLTPGETYSEPFELNKELSVFRHPGHYRVVVDRAVSYDNAGTIPHLGSRTAHFEAEFDISVVGNTR